MYLQCNDGQGISIPENVMMFVMERMVLKKKQMSV